MAKRRIGGRVTYIPRNAAGGAGGAAGGAVTGATIPAAQNAQQTPQPQPASNANDPDPLDWAKNSDGSIRILRAQMGQSGQEAGASKEEFRRGTPRNSDTQVYVDCAKSYLINNALDSDMTSVTQGYMPPNGPFWIRRGYDTAGAARDIKKMDKGMRPLTQDMKLVRFGDSFNVESFLGDKVSMSAIRGMNQSELNKLFVGRTRDTKRYLSTSWAMDRGSDRDAAYAKMDVAIEYTVKAGTHAIVTNNIKEHEIVLGRGYRETVKGVRMHGRQLVLSVEVDPGERPGYYKVR